MRVEPYAGLSHLVSTVSCRTAPGTRLRQVLEATFPPGSVTGAPKRRAIEIIEQLESEPRDVYTGAVGFVDRAGGVSLAVAIRTAVMEGHTVRYFAGGGIVEASDVGRELAETELKAEVFLAALSDLAKRPVLG
jgi:anthranilate/para-aminobenzoate synthase component I